MGAGRRWSADDEAKIVAETFVSGARMADVAGKHSIEPSLRFAWRREVRAKEHGVAAFGGFVSVHIAAPGSTTGMQNMVAEERPHRARSTAKKTGLMEIDLGGGKRARVASAADLDLTRASRAVQLLT